MAEKLDERSKALYFNEVAIPFYETRWRYKRI